MEVVVVQELDVADDEECIHGLTGSTCSLCKNPPRPISTSLRQLQGTSSDGRKTPENSSSYFGHSWPEWFAMREAGTGCIIERAECRQTTPYHELWAAIGARLGIDLGTSWRQMPNLLGYISEKSYEDFRLLLTALVVEDQPVAQPGEGFFRLAATLRLLPERDAPPQGVPWLGMTEPQRTFWQQQVEAIFDRFGPSVHRGDDQ